MTRVRGEQPLPGATERLLQATANPASRAPARVAEYRAVSVQQRSDGTWRAMSLRLDPQTRRVVPTLLDSWTQPGETWMTAAEALLYWAQQQVLDERGVLE